MLVSAMLKMANSINFELNFGPRCPTPALFPLFIWKNRALNNFTYAEKTDAFNTQDVSHLPLQAALQQIYPRLSFGELALLFDRLEKSILQPNLDFNTEALFACYQFRYDARLEKVLRVFLELPETFQRWAVEHEASPRDLSPLVGLPQPANQLSDLLNTIASSRMSRSQGAQALELAVELILLDHSWEDLAPPEEKDGNWAEQWFKQLKEMRFPVTTQKDTSQIEQFSKLPWSKDFSTKWARSGDKSGLEVKFLLTSKHDLEKKLQTLQRIHESWKD